MGAISVKQELTNDVCPAHVVAGPPRRLGELAGAVELVRGPR